MKTYKKRPQNEGQTDSGLSTIKMKIELFCVSLFHLCSVNMAVVMTKKVITPRGM